jgi:hypothetical protein
MQRPRTADLRSWDLLSSQMKRADRMIYALTDVLGAMSVTRLDLALP